MPFDESIGAFVELRDAGKVRHIGLSNVSERHVRTAQRLIPVASIQNRYNLADRSADAVVLLCEQEGMIFIPWAPIQDAEGNETVSVIADRHEATSTQVVLAWLLARSPAMVPIPGTSSLSHLEANIAAADLQLTTDEVEALTRSARGPSRARRALARFVGR